MSRDNVDVTTGLINLINHAEILVLFKSTRNLKLS